ncbi:DUF2922 domain-containing protein [Bacillus fonticola]|uniref:DUF2922 domain-containing protein n=1 Tax=Bacillus fonticola TaxID=2728853 RepID=UPI001472EF6C
MAKTLELQFDTNLGKVSRVSIADPKEPVDMAVVQASMDQLIQANVFLSTAGYFVKARGARLIERNVTDYELQS